MITQLESERLVLRQWRASDIDWFAELYADPVPSAHVGGPRTLAQAWRQMAAFAGIWSLRGFGKFVLETKADKRGIGHCGLWHPADFPEIELGWGLLATEHGKGYATEAAQRVKAHAFEDRDLPTLVSFVAPDNLPSRRVAERLGGKAEPTREILGKQAIVYRYAKLTGTGSIK